MTFRFPERALQLSSAVHREAGEIRRVWTGDRRARQAASWSMLAGVSVVGLALVVDILRYLDVHHYRARFLSLTTDRGLPELVMDALVLLAAFLTARLYLRTGLRGFAFVARLLTFVALDDFFSVHERFGAYIATRMDLPEVAGIAGNDWGELAVMAIFGIVGLPLLVWSLWGLHPANLAILVIYGVLLSAFAALAAGVDVLHSLVQSSFMDRLMGWIEDGGEILVMTSVSMVAILQWRGRPGR